jgi:glycosyltransferase involved in cell wall biosynthesis
LEKVSVIIPFYNGVEWLCEAVQSALDQTYDNIEIIVINDGSKEDVSEFLKKFVSKIIYFYQENKGASSARNLGIKNATGDFIAFLDSDDIWLPFKLEKQIKFMSSIGALWSHTNYFYWKYESNKLIDVAIKDEYGDIFEKSFISLRIATPSVVISKCVFDTIGNLEFDTNLKIGEDTKLWQHISRFYPIALLKEPLVKVRLRDDNTFKRTLQVLHHRANDYILNRKNESVPKIAKIRGIIFYLFSKILRLPSSPYKDFLARLCIVFPYIIGRVYVKFLSCRNKRFKNFVL